MTFSSLPFQLKNQYPGCRTTTAVQPKQSPPHHPPPPTLQKPSLLPKKAAPLKTPPQPLSRSPPTSKAGPRRPARSPRELRKRTGETRRRSRLPASPAALPKCQRNQFPSFQWLWYQPASATIEAWLRSSSEIKSPIHPLPAWSVVLRLRLPLWPTRSLLLFLLLPPLVALCPLLPLLRPFRILNPLRAPTISITNQKTC